MYSDEHTVDIVTQYIESGLSAREFAEQSDEYTPHNIRYFVRRAKKRNLLDVEKLEEATRNRRTAHLPKYREIKYSDEEIKRVADTYIESGVSVSKLAEQMDNYSIKQAKAYARSQNKSLSQIVYEYFSAIKKKTLKQHTEKLGPITSKLAGCLKKGDGSKEDYYKYLERKHS